MEQSLLFGLGVLVSFSISEAATSVPQSFTLDGQLYLTGSTSPLVDATAGVKVQILDPLSKCILYEENHFPVDTRPSGYFNIQVGSAVGDPKRTGTDPGNSMARVFQNIATIPAVSAPGQTCVAPFAPTAGDQRVFRLIVTPTATHVADTLTPDLPIDSTPNAIVAETLQGYSPSSFLLANSTAPATLTQAHAENVFSTTNYPILTSLLTNGANGYVRTSANGTVALPTVGGAPATPSAGQIWYDAGVIKFWDGSAAQSLGVSGAGITSLGVGTGLLPGGTISAAGSTLVVDVGTNAGQIVQVQTGSKLPVLDGSNLTNLKDTAISGNLSVTSVATSAAATVGTNLSVSGNSTVTGNATVGGNLSVTGFISSAETRASSLKVFNGADSIQFLAPALGGASTSFTLPATRPGVSGYVLSSDTSGVMSWVAQTPAGLSAVSNSASLAQDKIWIGDAGGKAQEQTLSGDVALVANGTATVNGIKGKTVTAAPTLTGQVLRYDGTNFAPNFISMFDLRSTVTGSAAFGGVGCLSNQTLTWTAATDNLACADISLPVGQVTGVLPVANGGIGTTSLTPTFVLNGGQNGAVSAGTNDANSLTLKSNNTARLTIDSGGNIGIGTSTPDFPLALVNNSGLTSGEHGLVWLGKTDDNSGPGLAIGYRANGSGVSAAYLRTAGSSGASDLVLGTYGSSQALTIQNGGNVGIGTATPGYVLHVQSSASTVGALFGADTGQNGLNVGVDSTNRWLMYQETAANNRTFNLYHNHSGVAGGAGTVMTATVGGNIGIGTSTPTAALDVNGKIRGTATVGYGSVGTGPTTTVTTNAYESTISASLSVQANDLVKVDLACNLSNSSSSSTTYMRSEVNSGPGGAWVQLPNWITVVGSNWSGGSSTGLYRPSADGTLNFRGYWHVSSGTGYAVYCNIIAYVIGR